MLDALTLDQLRVFVSVADKGSFRAAAKALGRAQSGLSSAIANLEAELKVSLFDRSEHRPQLTEVGTTLLAEARTLLIKADALRARATSFSRGVEPELNLALDPLLPLPLFAGVIRSFQATFPSVRLEMKTAPMTSAIAQVMDGDCDIGLTAADEQDAHIVSEAIGDIAGMVPVCRTEHPLAQARSTGRWTTVELADHVQIVVADPSERSQGRNFGVLSQQTCCVGDLATKHALILAGAGWGNLPFWMVDADLAAGRLAPVALAVRQSAVPTRVPVYIIRRIDLPFGPAASGLCHMLMDAFRAATPAGA